MDDLTLITLGETDPSIKPNTWPDAYRVWDVNEDRTHANGHLEWREGEPPEREPLTVTTPAQWDDLNDYTVGNEVVAHVAAYSGGDPDSTTYRWRFQTRASADADWVNGKWTNYTDFASEISTTLAEAGQIRFQCQARDTSVDPVQQLNSFASVKDAVSLAPLKCEQPPSISGELWVGGTLTGTKAIYSGGVPPVTVESQIQTSSASTGQPWSGVDAWGSEDAGTHTVGANEVGKYFRVAGRAIDQSENAISQAETLMSFSEVIGPVAAPLVVGTPTVTGEPIVGYTLSCSEPSIEGGSGDCQIDYFWVDETNAMVWESTYMGQTTQVVEYDLGKKMKCLVTVTDRVTGENETVASNEVGPINRPVLPEFDVWVDSELHDDPTEDVGVQPNGQVVIEVRPQPVSNPPIDLVYSWQIRTGTGRLSGDLDGRGIIYLAPDAAPAGALVTCTAGSDHANDSGYAAEVTILISE